ncbi:BA14K family protein [Nitratireductor sp. GCM10026969]|uniref:BA14K family protein n=1 Tax=Nitratireductor sp. GCM10026969 TaxID=3252645 RepID=UPI00360E1A66
MKRILSHLVMSGLFALGLAAAVPAAQASPASVGAATVNAVINAETAGNPNLVEVGDHRRHKHWRKHHRGDHRWRKHHRRDYDWRRHSRPRSGIYFEFGTAPRYARPRYVRPAPAYRLSRAHVGWCYDRYRSYRASDNTFQPYNGPRRQCVSPYMR